MKPVVIIPARLAATRLPNKPLADIKGEPMIVHVLRRATDANIGAVVVACCSQEVADIVEAAGGRAVLTDPKLPSGSDRIYAALQALDEDFDTVINLQGDLPTVEPDVIRSALKALENDDIDIGTVACETTSTQEIKDPNVVKIALSPQTKEFGRALYFSRAPIPANTNSVYHHIGIYAYRRPILEKFIQLPPSPLEKREKLEQLRALEAGMRIGVRLVAHAPISVDTPEDLERVRALI